MPSHTHCKQMVAIVCAYDCDLADGVPQQIPYHIPYKQTEAHLYVHYDYGLLAAVSEQNLSHIFHI